MGEKNDEIDVFLEFKTIKLKPVHYEKKAIYLRYNNKNLGLCDSDRIDLVTFSWEHVTAAQSSFTSWEKASIFLEITKRDLRLHFIYATFDTVEGAIFEKKLKEKVPEVHRKFAVPTWLYASPVGQFIYHSNLRYLLQLFGYLLRIGGFLALLYAAALHMETVVDNLYHGKDLPVPGIINTIQYHVQIPIENFVKNIFTAAPGFINEHWIISLIIGAILLPISPILIMAGTSYVLIAALWILIFHFNMVLMYTIELGGKSFEAFGIK